MYPLFFLYHLLFRDRFRFFSVCVSFLSLLVVHFIFEKTRHRKVSSGEEEVCASCARQAHVTPSSVPTTSPNILSGKSVRRIEAPGSVGENDRARAWEKRPPPRFSRCYVWSSFWERDVNFCGGLAGDREQVTLSFFFSVFPKVCKMALRCKILRSSLYKKNLLKSIKLWKNSILKRELIKVKKNAKNILNFQIEKDVDRTKNIFHTRSLNEFVRMSTLSALYIYICGLRKHLLISSSNFMTRRYVHHNNRESRNAKRKSIHGVFHQREKFRGNQTFLPPPSHFVTSIYPDIGSFSGDRWSDMFSFPDGLMLY